MNAIYLFLSVLVLESVFVVLLLVVAFLAATGACMCIDWLVDCWYRAAFRRAARRGDVARVVELGDEMLGRRR